MRKLVASCNFDCFKFWVYRYKMHFACFWMIMKFFMKFQEGSSHERGLYQRSFEELFDLSNSDTTSTSQYSFYVTAFELYNEQVFQSFSSFCFTVICVDMFNIIVLYQHFLIKHIILFNHNTLQLLTLFCIDFCAFTPLLTLFLMYLCCLFVLSMIGSRFARSIHKQHIKNKHRSPRFIRGTCAAESW